MERRVQSTWIAPEIAKVADERHRPFSSEKRKKRSSRCRSANISKYFSKLAKSPVNDGADADAVEDGDGGRSPSKKRMRSDDIGDGRNDCEEPALMMMMVVPEFLSGVSERFGSLEWRKIIQPDLDMDYTILFSKREADELFDGLEKSTPYFGPELNRVKVYGKWHQIPRKQVAFGDPGLTYTFSGICLPSRPWSPLMAALKDYVSVIAKTEFNFVLINRYKDGHDYIGEHRDDEKDLALDAPIASLSLGQSRDFVLRHALTKNKKGAGVRQECLQPLTILLEHGSLLLMQPPTNRNWYHSLPVRKRAFHPRVNLTFRRILKK